MEEISKKSVQEHLCGWGVVSAASLLMLGAGVSIMTSPHPYIADTFFFVGFSLLLIKFWAWEGAKHDTTRKTAMLLAGVTVLTLLLFAGSCWLSYYLNLPKQAVAANPLSASQPVSSSPQSQEITQPQPSPANPKYQPNVKPSKPKAPTPHPAPEATPQSTPKVKPSSPNR
jgi:hypothetical protein